MSSSDSPNCGGPIVVVVGTRPEIIKVAPVIRACNENGLPNKIVHTGQHYSYELDSLIFQDLGLEAPSYNLGIGSGTHAEETAKALVGLEGVLREVDPSVVLVQGDTNSTLAGALAASKLNIPVGHIEAGLRSFDRRMAEEKNRVITDHLSDILFTPTLTSENNLIIEGIPDDKILLTGNTVVDAVNMGLHLIQKRSEAGDRNSPVPDEDFMLLTLHREENVDHEERLQKILKGVGMACTRLGTKIVFPAHPRTVARIKQYGIHVADSVLLTPPVGYLDFLSLERDADLILTDSGGVQEEACILEVPCVTLRDSTERPETVQVGANRLVGLEPEKILDGVTEMGAASHHWKNPFGDGKAGARIAEAIAKKDWSMTS